MADANIAVSFTASVSDFTAGVAQAKDALGGIAASIAQMNAQCATVGATITQAMNPGVVQPFNAALQASAALQGELAGAHARAQAAQLAGDAAAYAQAMQIVAAGVQGEIKAIEAATRQKLDLYNGEVKTKEITEAQKTALTLDALQRQLSAEEAVLQDELRLDASRPLQRVRILEQLAQLESAYALQVQNVNLQAAEKSAQEWQSAFTTINGAFDSQVGGLLRGTETWHAAVKNVVTSLTEDVIKYFLNWGLRSAEAYALDLARNAGLVGAHVAGSAAIASADQAGAAASSLSWLGSALKSIAASAAETFAGVTGFMAPIIGPAAPAAGAAAMGTVLAVEGMLYDSGAWSVPQDMIAGIHQGEMIIPQRGGIADEFRSFMSGGGFDGSGASARQSVSIHPTTNFHVSAVDSGSVASWMKSNSAAMMQAMDEAVRHGAHLGLRRLAGA